METFTRSMEGLRKSFDAATVARFEEVAKLRSEARDFVHHAHERFQQMAHELHDTLRKNESNRRASEVPRAHDRAAKAHQLHEDVQRTLKELQADFAGGSRAFHHRAPAKTFRARSR